MTSSFENIKYIYIFRLEVLAREGSIFPSMFSERFSALVKIRVGKDFIWVCEVLVRERCIFFIEIFWVGEESIRVGKDFIWVCEVLVRDSCIFF